MNIELFDTLLMVLHHIFGCCKHCWLQHKAAENTLLPIHNIVVRITRAYPYSNNIHIGWLHQGQVFCLICKPHYGKKAEIGKKYSNAILNFASRFDKSWLFCLGKTLGPSVVRYTVQGTYLTSTKRNLHLVPIKNIIFK